MNKYTAMKLLKSNKACGQSIKYAEKYKYPQTAWNNCKRGDWMLNGIANFVAEQGSDLHHKLVLCACECGRQSLKYARHKDLKVIKNCYRVTELWTDGKASLEEVEHAAGAAGATGAAWATGAAYGAAYGAVWAAEAAWAAAAAGAATWVTEAASLSESADIVRKHFPKITDFATAEVSL